MRAAGAIFDDLSKLMREIDEAESDDEYVDPGLLMIAKALVLLALTNLHGPVSR